MVKYENTQQELTEEQVEKILTLHEEYTTKKKIKINPAEGVTLCVEIFPIEVGDFDGEISGWVIYDYEVDKSLNSANFLDELIKHSLDYGEAWLLQDLTSVKSLVQASEEYKKAEELVSAYDATSEKLEEEYGTSIAAVVNGQGRKRNTKKAVI